MISENLGISIRQQHDDVLDTVLGKVAHHIIDERLSPDRDHSFGDVAGQWREAGSGSAPKTESLHLTQRCRERNTPFYKRFMIDSNNKNNRSEHNQTINTRMVLHIS